MRAAALFLTLAHLSAPLSASAEEKLLERDYGLVNFPVCKNFADQKVQLVLATQKEIEEGKGTVLAAAQTIFGTPLIFLDRETLSRTPHVFQEQVCFHECAHHQLGHFGYSPEAEYEADCQSIKVLKMDRGLTAEQLATVKIYTEFLMRRAGGSQLLIEGRLKEMDRCFKE